MSTLTAPLGSRPIQSLLNRTTAHDGAAAQLASASGKVPAKLPVVDPVAPSSDRVVLSQQALNSRVAQLGDKTVDVAEKLIDSFAQSLFGDAAQGATFKFDAISLSANTSVAALVQHSSDSAGTLDAAALQLNESSHFIGRGQITTADGQSFNFEIEIKYEASATVAAAQSASRQTSAAPEQLAAPDAVALTGKQLPAIKFPGSLADLFKLLGRQLDVSADSGKNDGNSGNLSLRLIRLVNSAALIAPRVRADNPEATPAERNRALASYNPPSNPPAPSSNVTTA
jgi:hypothetical protein